MQKGVPDGFHYLFVITIHTATMIPMSATGVGAHRFSGWKDNTQIALTMAGLLGFSL